ncbi:MAG: S-methyl-5-thioribose-1-phosphate isomerase [Armatimonadota bacterium]
MKAIELICDHIKLIDQRQLPHKLEFINCFDVESLVEAIKSLAVRGAPALGVAAGFGIALSAMQSKTQSKEDLLKELKLTADIIKKSRPTAVNLFWALDRMLAFAESLTGSGREITDKIIEEAQNIAVEDENMCRDIGRWGAALVKDGDNILTHCNAGALATGGYGTAVGVIQASFDEGKKIHVYVDETRPLLQGARLTAWELSQAKIPYTLICDNMAGFLMKQGKVDKIFVGADRIAANGDTANKIGTYSLSVLAKANNVEFYIAAPFSTIDFKIKSGKEIPIEERKPEEVRGYKDCIWAPFDSNTYNPAFDVTDNGNITAIITERGIVKPPYEENLKKMYYVNA